MNPGNRAVRVVIAALAFGAAPAICADDAFPARTIRIVNPYAAGGTSDVIARSLARDMGASLKQPIIVDNRPGASGHIGSNFVRAAAPDGYTLLFTSSSALVGAIVKSPPPFDPYQDFTPVGRAVEYPLYVVVNPGVPATNLRELAAFAKSRPEPLFHTSIGIGSTGHLACEQLALAGGFKLNYIAYTSIPAALQSVMTNQTQLICDSVIGSQRYVTQGRLRGLAIMGKSRMPQVPDVPTTTESGFPGIESGVWLGMLAPRGTPPAVIHILNKAFNAAMSNPEMIARAQSNAMTIINESPEQAAKAIRADLDQWAEIIRVKQIKVVD